MVRRSAAALLGPLAALALLSACGSDDASTTPTSVPATATEAPAAEPAPADGRVAGDSTMLAVVAEYVYEGEPPALDGPAQAWHWAPGRTPTADEILAVAAAVGAEGELTEQSVERGGGWIVSDGEPSQQLSVYADAQGGWSFIGDTRQLCTDAVVVPDDKGMSQAGPPIKESAGADAPETPVSAVPETTPPAAADTPVVPPVVPPDAGECVEPVGIPTAAEAQLRASELLLALGQSPDDYELRANSEPWGAWVDAHLILDGLATPVLTSFGFGAEGTLTYASGQLFRPEPAGEYQRIGAPAALEQLKADQLRSYSPADAAAPDQPVASPADAGEPVVVTLTGVEAGWWAVWAADGSVWLMPGYDFTIAGDGGEISAPAVAAVDLPAQ